MVVMPTSERGRGAAGTARRASLAWGWLPPLLVAVVTVLGMAIWGIDSWRHIGPAATLAARYDAAPPWALSTWDAASPACATRGRQETKTPSYAGHRFPPASSAHAVWRSCRFALSDREVAELLAARGVLVTDETIRRWCRTFGQGDAHALRRRRPRPGDKRHRDAIFSGSNGVRHSRWRAVDQDGTVRDTLVQRRRDTAAARKRFRTLLTGLRYVPRVVITDTLARYGAAKRAVLPSVEHRQHRRRNKRTEHAHQPTRERERRMRRCKRPQHAQRFLAADGPIAAHFRPRRQRLTATAYRRQRDDACATWRAVTGVAAAA